MSSLRTCLTLMFLMLNDSVVADKKSGTDCSEIKKTCIEKSGIKVGLGGENSMDLSQNVEMLYTLQGKQYETVRDRLLCDSVDIAIMFESLSDSIAQNFLTTTLFDILSAYKKFGEQYKQFLSQIDSIDIDSERKKITGIPGVWHAYANKAKDEYGELILPLCWEVLIKYYQEWVPWKINIFITALEYIPARKSIDPLLYYLEHSKDSYQQRFTGNKLGYLALKVSEMKISERLQVLKKSNPSITAGIDEALFIVNGEKYDK